MSVNIGDILFQVVIFGLVILFFVSFSLFIRNMVINKRKIATTNSNIEQKLDRIIELLEKGN